MNRGEIRKSFEEFLRERRLKLTAQRLQIFERAFDTHKHFTADTLTGWLQDEGAGVSRATVYRTLSLLVEGGFLESLDTGKGEMLYEHVLGHRHHDHMVCLDCGRIEEFFDEKIEELQKLACRRKQFQMTNHNLRIFGYCKGCARKRGEGAEGAESGSRTRSTSGSSPANAAPASRGSGGSPPGATD